MRFHRPLRSVILLFSIALSACSINPRTSSVSLNGTHLLKEWRCEDAETRFAVERTGPDGIAPTIADKLLACPFYRDYQIAAMDRDNPVPVPYDMLAEIVYKMRWGIDYQYREYEEYVLRGPKKLYLIPRFLNKLMPGFADLLSISAHLAEQPVELGKAAPLIVRQMQADRAVTNAEIDRRMAALKAGKRGYPLWQVLIDLDAYFVAGTALNAIASLDKAMLPSVQTQKDL